MKMHHLLATLAFGLMLGLTTGAAPAQNNPCNPCGGKAANPCNPCGGKAANPCNPCGGKAGDGKTSPSVKVDPAHANMGTVFGFADPMQRNTVTFTSEAPLEDIVGTTNVIAGYLALDPADVEAGVGGKFVVPVATLNTGIPLRDEHLRSPAWMHAEKHPHITFQITGAEDVETLRRNQNFSTYNLTLTGPLTIHGQTHQAEVPVRLTYLRQSEQTRSKMDGNLVALRGEFSVGLNDYGIDGGQMGDVIGTKLSRIIDLEVRLMGSDALPASAGGKGAGNPCNPCGGKAGNPCNPCGGKAANPCNPCGGKAANPCNPCNPCGM